uniref:Lipoprotein n=1 Tax=Steinernema glaseri TaxID=37863 RepID=A0A1I7YZZ0_9BILA
MARKAALILWMPLAVFAILTLLPSCTSGAVWDNVYPDPEPIYVGLSQNLTFHANETKLYFRTESIQLNTSKCLEYHFRVKGKRTRLYVYTCRLSPGGRCVFHKYRETNGQMRCHYLSPWMRSHDEYAFFFHFERRPRSFRDEVKRQRYLRRVRRQKTFPVVGEVELHGLKPRREICRDDF